MSELQTREQMLLAALKEIADRDIAYLKTPSGNPETGYPGYCGSIARRALSNAQPAPMQEGE